MINDLKGHRHQNKFPWKINVSRTSIKISHVFSDKVPHTFIPGTATRTRNEAVMGMSCQSACVFCWTKKRSQIKCSTGRRKVFSRNRLPIVVAHCGFLISYEQVTKSLQVLWTPPLSLGKLSSVKLHINVQAHAVLFFHARLFGSKYFAHWAKRTARQVKNGSLLLGSKQVSSWTVGSTYFWKTFKPITYLLT